MDSPPGLGVRAAALALALAACAGAPAPAPAPKPFDQKVVVAAATGGAYAVDVRSDAALQVGLNALYLRVTSGGAPMAGGEVTLRTALRTSGGTRHPPVIGPGPATADGVRGAFAVLEAASGTGATWDAEIVVSVAGTATTIAVPSFAVVSGKNLARRFDSGGVQFVMALEFEQGVTVGLNPVVVTLHGSADGGATYEAVDDAVLALDPQMPSMGHGSPGSVNPARTSAGWYEGAVSFSMPGDWLTTIATSRAGSPIGAPAFLVFF